MIAVFTRSSAAASPCTDTTATTPHLSRLPSSAGRLLRIVSSSAPKAAARRLSPSSISYAALGCSSRLFSTALNYVCPRIRSYAFLMGLV
ncbi:hypothetical protein GUJ93_ZPchr0008g14109 [Zizania palustris]|uniref:Uncharacterized protein n=1 Tax=Zizania palustris TaxID=103762 RepID=A0A8J5VKK9_ZIZPA|nr:hypothetical protein GUJ93_ZPchr0008g14109 [Zizania palustris]